MRTLAMPKPAGAIITDPLEEKLIKIGAKIVNRGRYVTLRWPRLRCPGYSWSSC